MEPLGECWSKLRLPNCRQASSARFAARAHVGYSGACKDKQGESRPKTGPLRGTARSLKVHVPKGPHTPYPRTGVQNQYPVCFLAAESLTGEYILGV